jgi:indole-3-glycerol phosphate synthase
MSRQNVDDAPSAYEKSPIVRAISVLTNQTHFGMTIDRMQSDKVGGTKPVLRKDFIFDPYQVYEARAYGADAILLMANLLEPQEMQSLHELARELHMDALFECHNREQIQQVPAGAVIYGINSRTFDARKNTLGVGRYAISSLLGRLGSDKDLTIDESRFELGQFLPAAAIKVAESGVHPNTVAELRDNLGYDAALVGTSLLTARHGVRQELNLFESALAQSARPAVCAQDPTASAQS